KRQLPDAVLPPQTQVLERVYLDVERRVCDASTFTAEAVFHPLPVPAQGQKNGTGWGGTGTRHAGTQSAIAAAQATGRRRGIIRASGESVTPTNIRQAPAVSVRFKLSPSSIHPNSTANGASSD